jgi:hypothetical protein
MRRIGAPQLLVLGAFAALTSGCTVLAPGAADSAATDETPPAQVTETTPTPSPLPAAVTYDHRDAVSVVLTIDDWELLESANFGIPFTTTTHAVTVTIRDIFGEWVATGKPSPAACGPVYWLVAITPEDLNSSTEYVAGPAVEAAVTDDWAADTVIQQGVLVFDTPEQAQQHFTSIASAVDSCAEYQVEGQESLAFQENAVGAITGNAIHLRQLQTNPPDDGGPPQNYEDDKWVFLKGNLVAVLTGPTYLRDLPTLAETMRGRLDSLPSKLSAPAT